MVVETKYPDGLGGWMAGTRPFDGLGDWVVAGIRCHVGSGELLVVGKKHHFRKLVAKKVLCSCITYYTSIACELGHVNCTKKIRAGRAFLDLRSCIPGVLGPRARGNAIFLKHAGTQNAKK